MISEQEKQVNTIRVLTDLLTERDNQLRKVMETAEKLMNYIEDLEVGIPRPVGSPSMGVV